MLNLNLNKISCFFSKFFAPADAEAILEAIPASAGKVLFVDTGATPVLAETISALVERGLEVVIRDHHKGEGRSPESADAIETMLGDNARIVTRAEAPACAQLIELGEFSEEGTVIVADPDLDGLTAAMKAAGMTYVGMDADADVFDSRPKQSAENLTELGWTAVRGLSTLPPFNPKRPEVAEQAKSAYFTTFITASQGDSVALADLETRVAVYEGQVQEAYRLLNEKKSNPTKGVMLVDQVGADRADLSTLTKGMEKVDVMVTGVRKDFGPIAGNPGGHGVQFSLAVVRDHQKELDLRDLVPEGAESSPKAGLLSNTSFLLHCSEKVWEDLILPALKKRLG